MQIKHNVLRTAAAATVTMFMVAGAVTPALAVTTSTEDSSTTQTQTADGANGQGHGKKKSEETTEDSGSYDHSDGTAGTSGDADSPQPESNADENDGGANAGDCDEGTAGSYCSTRDGSPSENGKGDGKAKGKPCAGCVGKADNKNPKGQYPDGSDRNAGYECDRNQGIGQSNPAHTGCTSQEPEVTCPEGATMDDEGECVVPTEVTCPEGAEMNDEGECVVPTEEETCPEGAEMNDAGECVVPAEKETCPEDAAMNDDGECVVAPIVSAPSVPSAPSGSDEVAGVQLERSGAPQGGVEAASANRAPAEVAPASGGLLPDTGAGAYGLVILAAVGLLSAGGLLIARKRSVL